MEALQRLFGGRKKHKVEDSGTLLLALLRKRGLSDKNRDPMLAWSVFKEFCLAYSFQCDEDAVLWEIGPYGGAQQGEHCVQWHLVRQFTVGPGEDDDMSQVYLDLVFPESVGAGRQAVVWSYDFSGDLNAFFAAVEARPDFSVPPGTAFRSATVGLDRV